MPFKRRTEAVKWDDVFEKIQTVFVKVQVAHFDGRIKKLYGKNLFIGYDVKIAPCILATTKQPHFFAGEYSVSVFLASTSQTKEKENSFNEKT